MSYEQFTGLSVIACIIAFLLIGFTPKSWGRAWRLTSFAVSFGSVMIVWSYAMYMRPDIG